MAPANVAHHVERQQCIDRRFHSGAHPVPLRLSPPVYLSFAALSLGALYHIVKKLTKEREQKTRRDPSPTPRLPLP